MTGTLGLEFRLFCLLVGIWRNSSYMRHRAAGEKHEADDKEREKDRFPTARSLASHLVAVACHFVLSFGDGCLMATIPATSPMISPKN
jgi:hypothetical protein